MFVEVVEVVVFVGFVVVCCVCCSCCSCCSCCCCCCCSCILMYSDVFLCIVMYSAGNGVNGLTLARHAGPWIVCWKVSNTL